MRDDGKLVLVILAGELALMLFGLGLVSLWR